MKASDKVKMTINIGGEHLRVEVPFENQLIVRDAEKKADDLFKVTRLRYPSRTDSNIMAMVAFSLAQDFINEENVNEQAQTQMRLWAEKLAGFAEPM